jgi:hypothetical protein
MATWTAPVTVVNGDNLSALLWNNQLGTNGSLRYVYDVQNTIIANTLSRNVVLRKSTSTVLAAAGNSDIAFDTITANYSNDQLNFPITTPITAIPFTQAGIYMVSFTSRYSVASNITIKFTVTNGTTVIAQQHQQAYIAAGNVIVSTMITIESSSCTMTVNVLSSAAGTFTAAAATSTVDANMQLRIVKISGQ